MKRALGIALLVMLAVMSLGLAQAADPVVIEVPANDALNGSATLSIDENAGSGSLVVEGAATNEDPLDGYVAADSNGNCFADGDGDFNDDSDGDGEPDNQTCQAAVESYLP